MPKFDDQFLVDLRVLYKLRAFNLKLFYQFWNLKKKSRMQFLQNY